jgi:hypothetical protein
VNSLSTQHADVDLIDSAYAARRLFATLLLMTLGGSSMYVVSVVLPEVQKEFDISRADASLPYTLMMLGFGAGGLAMGKLADKWGVYVAHRREPLTHDMFMDRYQGEVAILASLPGWHKDMLCYDWAHMGCMQWSMGNCRPNAACQIIATGTNGHGNTAAFVPP